MPDSHPVMDLLMRNQKVLDEAGDGEAVEDPCASFMIGAWTRICKLMGSQFEQYLPMVMPVVMKAAAHKPDVAVVEGGLPVVLAGILWCLWWVGRDGVWGRDGNSSSWS